MSRPNEGVDNWVRIFGGFASLAVLWIAVYWWWGGPKQAPGIPIGTQPSLAANAGRASPALPPLPLVPKPAPMPLAVPSGALGQAGATTALQPNTQPEPLGTSAASASITSKPVETVKTNGPTMRIEPPKFRAYIVKKGDTLQRIAARELGSEKLWEAIAKANPFISPGTLQPGREIRIPLDPTNIQGKPLPSTGGEPVQDDSPGSGDREYVVKERDTLSGIAKKMYGDSRLAEVIFKANRDQLKEADDLKVGQKLKIPPKPEPKKPEPAR
jgi:nucleoid-associated protein YgaU